MSTLKKLLLCSLIPYNLFSNTISDTELEKPKNSLKDLITKLDIEYKEICKDTSINSKELERKLLAIRYEAEKLLLTDPTKFKKTLLLATTSLLAITCAITSSNSSVNYNPSENDQYILRKGGEYILSYLTLNSSIAGSIFAGASIYLAIDLQELYYEHKRLRQLIKNINVTLATLKN